MERPETWRELLAEITRDPQERERIVRELNVNPITITRWINDETVLRIDNLCRLLNAVSEQRERLFELLVRAFPDSALHVENDGSFNDEFSLDRVRAERIVWQQIEEELIHLASRVHRSEARET